MIFQTSIGIVTYKEAERPGYYNVTIRFYKGDKADYLLSDKELKQWKANPSGTFYNNRIRIKQLAF